MSANHCWMRVTIQPQRYCLRNRHAVMMDIATWAQEYFGKSLSLNTVHRCIKKCNLILYCAKRKAFINFVQNHSWVLWAQSHLRSKDSGIVFSRQTSPHYCFWEKWTLDSTCQRWKRTSRRLPTKSAKTSPCDSRGDASMPKAWVICTYVKVLLMRKLMLEFWRDISSLSGGILASPKPLFFYCLWVGWALVCVSVYMYNPNSNEVGTLC